MSKKGRVNKISRNDEWRIYERRKIVANRYLQGESQYAIARSFNPPLTQATISKDLHAIRDEWLQSAVQDYDKLKARELAKIDRMEEVCWSEYWRSAEMRGKTTKLEKELKVPKIDLTKNARGSPKFPKTQVMPDPVMTTVKIQKEYKVAVTGDVAYLDRIQWCVEMRCKILGLVKPPEVVQNNMLNVGTLNWDAVKPIEKAPVEDKILALERMSLPIEVEDSKK